MQLNGTAIQLNTTAKHHRYTHHSYTPQIYSWTPQMHTRATIQSRSSLCLLSIRLTWLVKQNKVQEQLEGLKSWEESDAVHADRRWTGPVWSGVCTRLFVHSEQADIEFFKLRPSCSAGAVDAAGRCRLHTTALQTGWHVTTLTLKGT